MTSGHAVCPSEQVDHVWHLHLTYTRSYWERFCKEVLGRPLHHDPTRGGPAENDKHYRMYEATLASYRNSFASEPPVDLWPPAVIRFGEDVQHRQINTRQNCFVPKSPIKRLLGAGLLVASLVIVCGCVAPVVANAQQDRELFLGIYAAAVIGALAMGKVIQRTLRQPDGPADPDVGTLDPVDTALLAGGPIRVFDTVLLQLIECGALSHMADGKIELSGELPDCTDPLERQIYDAVSTSDDRARSLDDIRKRIQFDLEPRKQSLCERGLYLSESRSFLAAIIPALSTGMVVIGLAIPRIVSGAEAKKPVAFLMFMMAIAIVISVGMFGRRPRRTLRGDAYVKDVLARDGKMNVDGIAAGSSVVLRTALLGTAVLAATEYDSLAKALHPKKDPTSSSGGCSSGCGGGCGGDAGGGGCGGGGCGGGGCGGD